MRGSDNLETSENLTFTVVLERSPSNSRPKLRVDPVKKVVLESVLRGLGKVGVHEIRYFTLTTKNTNILPINSNLYNFTGRVINRVSSISYYK